MTVAPVSDLFGPAGQYRARLSGDVWFGPWPIPTRNTRPRIGWARLVSALGLLIGVSRAPAQVVNSTLVGTVTDSSGASAPNATVRATGVSTGTVQSSTATVAGTYNLTYLSPQAYRVTIEAKGFRTYVQLNNCGAEYGLKGGSRIHMVNQRG
jgi:hypothetical protein